MSTFIYTLLISFNLYSPYTVASQVIFNVIIIFFIIGNKAKYAPISKLDKTIIFFSFIIFLWVLVISLVNSNLESYVIGRFLRIVINTLLLAIIVRNYPISPSKFLTALNITLSLNTIAVLIQFAFPSLKSYFISFAEYEKGFLDLRSFGLFASYDASGLCIIISSFLFAIQYIKFKKTRYLYLFFLTIISTFFVSRFSMLMAILIFIPLVSLMLKSNRMRFLWIFIPVSIISFYYLHNFAYNIYVSTFVYQDSDINQSYNSKSANVLTDDMMFLPKDFLEIVLGTGADPKESDSGYVKIIFMGGVTLLLLIISFYIYTIRNLNKKNKRKFTANENLIKYLIYSIFVFMLIYNYKLLLLYGRGFQDLFILIVFYLENEIENSNLMFKKLNCNNLVNISS